jgi:hypothetical protein
VPAVQPRCRFRPSSRATAARRSLRGERRPLSRLVGMNQVLRRPRPADKSVGHPLAERSRLKLCCGQYRGLGLLR